MTFAGILVGAVVSPGDAGAASGVGLGLVIGFIGALYAFVIAFPCYLIGLIVVGIPTWWALHSQGRAGLGAFVGIGAVESVLAGALVFRLLAPGSELFALLLTIPGGLAGWIIWREAYSPIKPPPARPS